MCVEKFVKTGESTLFNPNKVQGKRNYLIKLSDYMTLNYFPLIDSGEGQ